MNKTLYVLFAALILAAVSVSAIESLNGLYKYRCEIVRPATEFRPEKSFGYIGIVGRLSDGSLTCFIPNSRPKKAVVNEPASPPAVVVPDPVCHTEEYCETETINECTTSPVCESVCHREKVYKRTCEWKHGKLHCDNGWVWEEVCSEVCRDVTVCRDVEHRTCHDREVCST